MRPVAASEVAPVLEMLHERQEQAGYLSEADIEAAAAAAEVSASDVRAVTRPLRLEPGAATTAVCKWLGVCPAPAR
jgi:NADH:ubiquinone oxidoreductase subunit E